MLPGNVQIRHDHDPCAGTYDGRPVSIAQTRLDGDAQILARRTSAIAAATSLRHKHLLKTYTLHIARPPGMSSSELQVNVVQELCAGGSLKAAIEAHVFAPERLENPFATLLQVLREVAAGMAHAHACGIALGTLSWEHVFLDVPLSRSKAEPARLPVPPAELAEAFARHSAMAKLATYRHTGNRSTILADNRDGVASMPAREDVRAFGLLMHSIFASIASSGGRCASLSTRFIPKPIKNKPLPWGLCACGCIAKVKDA